MIHKQKNLFREILLIFLWVFVTVSAVSFFGVGITHAIVFRYDYNKYDTEKYLTYSDISEKYPRKEVEIMSGINTIKAYVYGEQNDTGIIIVSPEHTDTNDIKLYEIMYFVGAR